MDAMLETTELESFVDRYADKAYAFAYGLCGNEPDARELVQAAFVRIFEHAESFDASRASLENWFLTILRRIHVDGLRRWERRRGLSLDKQIGDDGLTVADALPDRREEALLTRLERRENGERVRAALEELSPGLRAVVMLVDVEGLGYEESARVLDCPLGTVRSRINRARTSLKERLLEMEVEA